jgi:hypothetical protein
MLSVAKLKVYMLSAIMLSLIMLSPLSGGDEDASLGRLGRLVCTQWNNAY